MAASADAARLEMGWRSPRRWPTGAKLFLSLSLALLPLAVIATLATWQTARIFNEEALVRLRTATVASGRALDAELVGDMTALATATAALDRDPADIASCARVRGVFAAEAGPRNNFAITDRHGRVVCGDRFPGMIRPARNGVGRVVAHLLPEAGLVLGTGGARGHAAGSALFAADFLGRIAHPTGVGARYAATLRQGEAGLPLASLASRGPLERRNTLLVPLTVGGLVLAMQVPRAPIAWPLTIALLLPMLMWAAAVTIAWLVVDRLLARPLRHLRSSVAAYRPGDVIAPGDLGPLPAQEIVDLGDTFRAITRTVALHEEGLAQGLVRQTRLTREVHHRVKNNLQVISSLINIHARASRGTEAATAYASIQRRVDALAVVHRNHFAENEANRGLPIRSVLAELASNIRSTAPDESAHMAVTLDIDPFLVSQDTAVAIAFLVTEAIELAMTIDPVTQVRVALKATDNRDDRALLSVAALALAGDGTLDPSLNQRYGRVIDGLARQLRSRLLRDTVAGRYEIEVAVTDRA